MYACHGSLSLFFFSSRRRHTRWPRDWSSDVCSSDLKRAIGTTGRGIGPAYMDKIGRLGIRVQDLYDESILRQKIEGALRQKNELLVKLNNSSFFWRSAPSI